MQGGPFYAKRYRLAGAGQKDARPTTMIEGARPMTCATDRYYMPRCTILRASTAVNGKEGYE